MITHSTSPLVSLIVPFSITPKAAHIKSRALEFTTKQYPSWVEIILVDATPIPDDNVGQEFAQAGNKVKYLKRPQDTNFSLGKARNEGAVVAEGNYLFFMDVDFIYADTFWIQLEKTILRDIEHPKNYKKFIMVPCLYLNEMSTRQLQNTHASTFEKIKLSVLEGSNQYISTIAIVSSTIVVHREYFLSLGGFREDYLGHGCEEFDFLHRLALNNPEYQRPDDYGIDDVQQLPGNYKGFRKYFLYYGLAYFFESLILLHRYHSRSLLDPFYHNRKNNEKKLKANMIKYDEGLKLPSLSQNISSDIYTSISTKISCQETNNPSVVIKEIQERYGFPVKKYHGLFFYQKNIKIESGNFLRKLRKLYRNPKKYFLDMKLIKYITNSK